MRVSAALIALVMDWGTVGLLGPVCRLLSLAAISW